MLIGIFVMLIFYFKHSVQKSTNISNGFGLNLDFNVKFYDDKLNNGGGGDNKQNNDDNKENKKLTSKNINNNNNKNDNNNNNNNHFSDLFILEDNKTALPVLQSKQCTLNEIQKRIQCFTMVPKLEYVVLENDTVVIPCIVSNQHGKVQWRAKSILLGYDRSVPGMPQIEIIGDVTKGEHNLRIVHAQLNDSGEYECQVQPVDHHPLLRRRSRVFVTRPPSKPEVRFEGKPIRNNQVIINRQNSNSQKSKILNFYCYSRNAVPSPEYGWRWNSRWLDERDQGIKIVNDDGVKWNGTKLSIVMDILKSGDKLRCLVRNRATEKMKEKQIFFSSKFETAINILVYTEPGKPVIVTLHHTESVGISEWQKIEIHCLVKPMGEPAGTLSWYFLSSGSIDSSWQPLSSNTPAGNDNNVFPNISISQSTDKLNDEIRSGLSLSNLSRRFHNSHVLCRLTHPLIVLNSEKFQILIKYSPLELHISTLKYRSPLSKVNLSEVFHMSELSGIENSEIEVICRTSHYFGSAQLKWMLKQGSYISNIGSEVQEMSPLYSGNNRNKENLTVQSYITQKLRLTRNLYRGYLMCKSSSFDFRQTVTVKSRLNVFYPPRIAIVSGYVNQFPVHEQEQIHMTCCAYGGNPTPILHWYKFNSSLILASSVTSDSQLATTTATSSSGEEQKQQILVLRINVSRQINGHQFYCTAESRTDAAATSTTTTTTTNIDKQETSAQLLVKSRVITINVVFPADNVSLRCERNCDKSGKFHAGRETTFLCDTSSSNPGSLITWNLINCSSSCISKEVRGALSTNIPSSFNGWKTQSRLRLRINPSYHNQYIECRVKLSFKLLPDRYKPRVALLKLLVVYAPVIRSKHKFHSVVNVTEGAAFFYTPDLDSNPPPTTIKWSFNDRVITYNSSLLISHMDRKLSGRYELLAINNIGSDSLVFDLNVMFPPRLINKSVIVNEESAILWSRINLNPFKPTQTFYQKLIIVDRLVSAYSTANTKYYCNETDEYYNSPINCTYQNHILAVVYTVQKNESNSGWYRFYTSNGIGKDLEVLFNLLVPAPPQPIQIRHFMKATASLNQSADVSCCFLSHLPVQIHLSGTKLPKALMASKTKQQTPGIFCAQFRLPITSADQYGSYNCQARSTYGLSKNLSLTIRNHFIPESPQNFTVIVTPYNQTVTAYWIQGAWGASDMVYKIRWRRQLKQNKIADSIWRLKRSVQRDNWEKTVRPVKWREQLTVEISRGAKENNKGGGSGLETGNYEADIGVSNSYFPTLRYCCLVNFSISPIDSGNNASKSFKRRDSLPKDVEKKSNQNLGDLTPIDKTDNNGPLDKEGNLEITNTSLLVMLIVLGCVLLSAIIVTISVCSVKYRKLVATSSAPAISTLSTTGTDSVCNPTVDNSNSRSRYRSRNCSLHQPITTLSIPATNPLSPVQYQPTNRSSLSALGLHNVVLSSGESTECINLENLDYIQAGFPYNTIGLENSEKLSKLFNEEESTFIKPALSSSPAQTTPLISPTDDFILSHNLPNGFIQTLPTMSSSSMMNPISYQNECLNTLFIHSWQPCCSVNHGWTVTPTKPNQ